MKKFYLISFIVCVIGGCVPEPEGPAPEDLFVKYYGKQGLNTAKDIVVTSEGDFIILGAQEIADDVGGSNFYLIKADKSGNLITSDTLNYKNRNDVPSRIKAISDTEFLVIGTSTSRDGLNKQLIYARINDQLEIQSNNGEFYTVASKVISAEDTVAFNLEGNDIIRVDGATGPEYILLGTADTESDGKQIFLSKRDASDNRVWLEDKYLGYKNGLNERALSVFQKPDGKLMIVGSTERQQGSFTGSNIYILITNHRGSDDVAVVTGLTGSEAANDIPFDVLQKSSNSYLIVGSTAKNGITTSFQMEISSGGSIISQHVVGSFRGSEEPVANQAFGITRTLSNEFIVVGKYLNFTQGEAKQDEMMVIRTSRIGEHISEADQYYGLAAGHDEANAVVTTADGDVVVAATIDFGSSTRLIGLLKLNKFGELKD